MQVYDAVTVLSSDIQGFCNILERSSPMQAMSMLNTMMLKFDALCDQNKCVKVCVLAGNWMVTPLGVIKNKNTLKLWDRGIMEYD